MKIMMPTNSFCRSWPMKTQNVIFSLRPYFSMAKVPTSVSLFLLDAFYYCFFSKLWWFFVCKTTFKGFSEISLQKHLCHERMGASFKMVGPPQLWKILKTEPNFQYDIKWDANKNQDRPHFHTCMMFMYRGSYMSGHLIWNLCNKLCNFGILRAFGEHHSCKILFIVWPLQRSYTLKITQVRRSIAVWTTCRHWFCSITQRI